MFRPGGALRNGWKSFWRSWARIERFSSPLFARDVMGCDNNRPFRKPRELGMNSNWARYLAQLCGGVLLWIAPGVFTALTMAASVPARAASFEQAACYVFGGREKCRTVRVVYAEECIVKVNPQPLPDLEPRVAVCLRDEVQTRRVHLRKVNLRNFVVTEQIRFRNGHRGGAGSPRRAWHRGMGGQKCRYLCAKG